MHITAHKAITTLAIGGLLLLGFDYATYAANGDSLLIGKANQGNKVTQLRNVGPGPALRLQTRPAKPPMTVTSTRRVKNLNVDRVDGQDARDLTQVRAGRFVDEDVSSTFGTRSWDIPDPDPGPYLITFSTGIFPNSGTPAAPNAAECLLQDVSGTVTAGFGTYDGGFVPLISGATVHRVTQASNLSIICGTEAAGPNRLFYPLTVSLTRLDGASTIPITPTLTGGAPEAGSTSLR